MSRGMGRVQRAILSLIETDVDGVWLTADICRHVYGVVSPAKKSVRRVKTKVGKLPVIEKRHRVAVARAIRTMTLPGLWRTKWVWKPGNELYLYNAGSIESTLHARWLRDGRPPAGWATRDVERFANSWGFSGSKLEVAQRDVAAAIAYQAMSTEEREAYDAKRRAEFEAKFGTIGGKGGGRSDGEATAFE
jgi:hypothetical protein